MYYPALVPEQCNYLDLACPAGEPQSKCHYITHRASPPQLKINAFVPMRSNKVIDGTVALDTGGADRATHLLVTKTITTISIALHHMTTYLALEMELKMNLVFVQDAPQHT